LQVNTVYSTLEDLLNKLEEDITRYLKDEHNSNIIWNKYFESKGNTTAFAARSQIHFLELLCHLQYPENAQQALIDSLKDYYVGKASELNTLDEFQDSYRPEKAVWWYTRPTFFYRLVNKALRHNNIEIIFLFGFFIQNIYRNLKEHNKSSINDVENPIIKVYRGQMMYADEITMLTSSQYPLITNSFLSTTCDRSLALLFLSSSTHPDDKFQSVLFDIEIDRRRRSMPYASIAKLSHVPDEWEYLFFPGTTFTKILPKIYYGDYENGSTMIIKLKLEDDHYVEQKRLQDSTLGCRRLLKKNISIFTEAGHVPSLSEFDAIFDGLLSLYPQENEWILAIKYHCIAPRSSIESTTVISYYEKALTLWQKFTEDDELNCHIDLAHLYKDMGDYYHYKLKDLLMAKKQYDLSIGQYETALNQLCKSKIVEIV
jgi:hypothetical protein